jgi:MFS family permease
VRCLLALRDARLFLAGQSLSLLGDTALWLALGLWAKDLTGSSSAAGLVILCIVAPQLASPVAGLLVDRVRRRTVLLVVNPLTALAVLPLLAVHSERDVWIIYAFAFAFAYGTSSVVLAAGQSALLHTLVPAELLGTANAALQTVREALRLITPLAGAGLYTLAGGAAVALLDAATFLAATAALHALNAPAAEHAAAPAGPGVRGVRAGAGRAADVVNRPRGGTCRSCGLSRCTRGPSRDGWTRVGLPAD